MKLTDDDIDTLGDELYEVMADLEDLDDVDLIECREVMLEKINKCLDILDGREDE